jgi:hypothetical protein
MSTVGDVDMFLMNLLVYIPKKPPSTTALLEQRLANLVGARTRGK